MTPEARRVIIRRAQKKRRDKLKAEGKCVDCGAPKDRTRGVLCRKCSRDRVDRQIGFRLCANCADSNCNACDGCDCSCSWMDALRKPVQGVRPFEGTREAAR